MAAETSGLLPRGSLIWIPEPPCSSGGYICCGITFYLAAAISSLALGIINVIGGNSCYTMQQYCSDYKDTYSPYCPTKPHGEYTDLCDWAPGQKYLVQIPGMVVLAVGLISTLYCCAAKGKEGCRSATLINGLFFSMAAIGMICTVASSIICQQAYALNTTCTGSRCKNWCCPSQPACTSHVM
jgi:hypothetical protein